MHRRWIIRGFSMLACITACGTLLTGCSDAESTAVHPQANGSSTPQTMQSRDDLKSPRALAWDSWREVSPTRIEVTFLSGPTSCFGVHVKVSETAQTVSIKLEEGQLPNTEDCPAIALTTTTTVDLTAPLNKREVTQS